MPFGIRKPKITRDQSMAARPVHLVKADLAETENGGGKLTVPLRQSGWSGWLFRLPDGAKKTFELDALGLLVWKACDGKASVQQIIRKLAKAYNLNLREAEVATLAFLRMLAKKGLIGMSVKETKKG
jgi:hypothetical protein